MRYLSSVTASVLVATTFQAAPLPKALKAPALEGLYGKPIDDSKKCEFILDAQKLRVMIPSEVDSAATHLTGSPRTSRIIAGDFSAEALVWYNPPDNDDGKVSGHLGAGIAAWVDENNYAFINRHHWPAGPGKEWSGGFDTHLHWDSASVSHGATCEGTSAITPSRLRLIRQGDSITSSESRDGGKTWQTTANIEARLPKELQVGVVAVNATKRKVEVIFESFVVTQK